MGNKPAWQRNAPGFLKPRNMETYAAPRDWDKACALQNLRAGVPLTDTQKTRFPDLARVEVKSLEAMAKGQTWLRLRWSQIVAFVFAVMWAVMLGIMLYWGFYV